jgi:hypothetical protein
LSGPLAGRPEWVLFGTPTPTGDRYVVIASRTLTEAELETKVVEPQPPPVWDGYGPLFEDPGPPEHHLTVVMDDFVLVTGPSYLDCLRNLMETGQWQPDTEDPPALPPRRGEGTA